MNKIVITTSLFFFVLQICNAQLEFPPFISFEERPVSFSTHICSDGNSYFTVNGGVPGVGKIFHYSLKGELIKSYPMPFDMRSIMYNKKTKSLYVNTTDKKVYRIIDLNTSTYQLVFSNLYENKQASLALDSKGKFLFVFDNGTLSKFNFKTGILVQTLTGLKCGDGNRKGAATVAVAKKVIYTWDSDSKMVYAYNKKGRLKNSYILRKGDFGYSLSFANGMIFVSHSLKNKKGIWYGYNFWGM